MRGEKVVLREKRWEDATKDYAWRSDEELASLDAAPPLKIPYTEYVFEHATELNTPSQRRCRFAIEDLNGNHIGNCMYYDIDTKKGQAELGIMIGDRSYWEQGYGTDAITVLAEHIFSTTHFKRVYLKTLDWNTRAQRCFARCGFVPYGSLNKRGRNFVLMELTRQEWERRKLASPSESSTTA